MGEQKLFMILLGGKPTGRHTEQHDIFFGIGDSLGSLIPAIKAFWPEIKTKVHIDAYREIQLVDGYSVSIVQREDKDETLGSMPAVSLFFLNLGGYKQDAFDEFHYKLVIAATSLDAAKKQAMKHAFVKHHDLEDGPTNHTAKAHIDDKYGIDVDDAYAIEDILNWDTREKYNIVLEPAEGAEKDAIHLGYIRLVDIR